MASGTGAGTDRVPPRGGEAVMPGAPAFSGSFRARVPVSVDGVVPSAGTGDPLLLPESDKGVRAGSTVLTAGWG
ncbi:hypothetical protein GCM10009696_00390 [Kocuria himachalensis]